MHEPGTLESPFTAIIRAVVDRLRDQTRGRIRGLDVECDGDFVTIRGAVGSHYLWQLGFSAARMAARESGGLLFDFQVVVVPPTANL
jgi:hypothetical protein